MANILSEALIGTVLKNKILVISDEEASQGTDQTIYIFIREYLTGILKSMYLTLGFFIVQVQGKGYISVLHCIIALRCINALRCIISKTSKQIPIATDIWENI